MSEPEWGLPLGVDRPAFAEPWQAQVFAVTVHLHHVGVMTWSEWTAALSAQLHAPDAAHDGHDYYEHWLRALELLVEQKGITDGATLELVTAAWQRAAEATPHGKPILLENDPLSKFPAS